MDKTDLENLFNNIRSDSDRVKSNEYKKKLTCLKGEAKELDKKQLVEAILHAEFPKMEIYSDYYSKDTSLSKSLERWSVISKTEKKPQAQLKIT